MPPNARSSAARSSAFVLVLLVAIAARAQTFTVSGSVFDDADGSVLSGAVVQLIDASDSTQHHATLSDDDGHFVFNSVVAGSYRLRASFIGFAQLEQPVSVNADVREISFRLKTSSTELKAVEKVATQPRIAQKGDTTIYNASAYKVLPDVTAADLLKKMPGIQSGKGTLTAQGEQVVKVLVDGEEFFGNNAIKALESLPAAMIDKVEVFDKKSDQAQFTGFDDGNSEKTVNIVTKKGMDHGVFGNASLGYGTDNRYQGDVSLNWFNGARRIGLMGSRDNTYQQGYLGQSQPGINTSNFIGLDYNDKIGKTKLSGDYYFSGQRNISTSNSERTTYLSDTTAQVTNSDNNRSSDNYSHNFSFHIETQLDSMNSVILEPQLGIQQSTSDNSQISSVLNGDSLQLSATDNNNKSDEGGLNFSNSLLFRHRFAKKGRTFSANLTTLLSRQNSTGTLVADNHFLQDTTGSATFIDQRSTGDNFTQNQDLQLNYSEPVSEHGQLQFTISPAIQLSRSNKLTYDIDPDTGEELLNTALSNKVDNTIQKLRGGVSYGYEGTGYTFNLGLDGQGSAMHSEQTYPFGFTVDRHYANLLPNAMFSKNWSNTRVNISYRSSVNTPSISQLQTVVNNSDPLNLTVGNLGLGQSYLHALSIRFNAVDSSRTRSFFTYLDLQSQPGRISGVTFIPTNDSTLAGGMLLPAGSQLTLPKNLDGYVSARGYANYSMPIALIKSDLSLNGGTSIERLPGEVNGAKSLTWNTNWQVGTQLSSIFSDAVDLSIGYTANFHTARSDLRSSMNNSYYQGEFSGELKLIGLKGWVLDNEVGFQQYVGLGAAYDRNPLVWNAGIGHKFLKHDALEFRVLANDILDRNVSVTRDVGDTYVQKSVANMLRRYVMFSLSYNLRTFKDPAAE